MIKNIKLYRLILSAMLLALALVLPFLTGQIPNIGKMLCPMHIPILLCGFFCGPYYAAAIGIIAPFLRSWLFGMPALFPDAVVMFLELATYGFIAGLLFRLLPKKKIYIYVSLISAMLAGRIVWGIVKTILMSLGKIEFGFQAFLTIGFANALPGIIVQIILIPILVIILNKFTYSEK